MAVRELFWQFFIYSFLGFLLEVAFARLTHAAKRDRKCMFLLPLCPVYGLGGVLIAHLPGPVRGSPLPLFLLGALAATAAEYVMDWFYEKVLRVRFWDYSGLPWNIHGRVCLPFSAAWGLLSLLLTAWVHPAVEGLIRLIPAGLAFPVGLLTALDALFTAYVLRAAGDTGVLRWYDRFRPSARERL